MYMNISTGGMCHALDDVLFKVLCGFNFNIARIMSRECLAVASNDLFTYVGKMSGAQVDKETLFAVVTARLVTYVLKIVTGKKQTLWPFQSSYEAST